MSENNVIYGINGPVVTIKGETGLSMMEMVYVGEKRLVGEVIRLDKDLTTIQVYEETTISHRWSLLTYHNADPI